MTESCETCRFMRKAIVEECHKSAPFAFQAAKAVWAEWPRVRAFDWCGEYERAASKD